MQNLICFLRKMQEMRSVLVKCECAGETKYLNCSAGLNTFLPLRLLSLVVEMIVTAYQVFACNSGGKTDNVTCGRTWFAP